jgi:acetoin utilization protein AcuB
MKTQSPDKSEQTGAVWGKLTVKDRMNPSPITVTSDDSLHDALEILHRHNIRELPVVEHGSLIGIVTDRDLRQVTPSYPLFRDREEIEYYSRNLKVAAAMTPDPMVVLPDTPLVEAAKQLDTYRIGSLPVVAEGKLVGIISVSDILKAFIEQNMA